MYHYINSICHIWYIIIYYCVCFCVYLYIYLCLQTRWDKTADRQNRGDELTFHSDFFHGGISWLWEWIRTDIPSFSQVKGHCLAVRWVDKLTKLWQSCIWKEKTWRIVWPRPHWPKDGGEQSLTWGKNKRRHFWILAAGNRKYNFQISFSILYK